MDSDTASQFVSCLVRCIQAFCHGYVQFSSSIEIVGHIYLNVDKGSRFNYIVNEEVSKNQGSHSTVYHTNSYHSLPPARDMLLKMSTHRDHGVEFMADNQGVKTMESFLDTTSSALPTTIEKTFSAAHPVSLIKVERASANRLEMCTQNLPHEEYKNKSPPLSSTSAGLPKVKTHPRAPQKQETSCCALNPSIVIKQEPEVSFFCETKQETEDESLAADGPSEDDNNTVIPPHPLTNPRIHGRTVPHQTEDESFTADGPCEDDNSTVIPPHPLSNPRIYGRIDLPAEYDSVSFETASSQATKSLSVQIRRQIVAHANIVGNRPAARHFGVHESSIRHWRKKFGSILQGDGGRRGRKRKCDYLQGKRGEVIQASVVTVDDSD